jgi:hypothetical protein
MQTKQQVFRVPFQSSGYSNDNGLVHRSQWDDYSALATLGEGVPQLFIPGSGYSSYSGLNGTRSSDRLGAPVSLDEVPPMDVSSTSERTHWFGTTSTESGYREVAQELVFTKSEDRQWWGGHSSYIRFLATAAPVWAEKVGAKVTPIIEHAVLVEICVSWSRWDTNGKSNAAWSVEDMFTFFGPESPRDPRGGLDKWSAEMVNQFFNHTTRCAEFVRYCKVGSSMSYAQFRACQGNEAKALQCQPRITGESFERTKSLNDAYWRAIESYGFNAVMSHLRARKPLHTFAGVELVATIGRAMRVTYVAPRSVGLFAQAS